MKLTERRHRSYQVKVDAANMLKEKERAKARVAESARKNSATKRRNCRKRTDQDPSEVDPQSSAGRAILSSLGITLTDSGESSPCPSANSINASIAEGMALNVTDQRLQLRLQSQQQQQQNMLMMGECDKDQREADEIDQEGEGEEPNILDTSIIGESGVQLRGEEGDENDDDDGDDIFEEEGGRGYMITTRCEGRSDSLVSPPVPPLAGTPTLGDFTPREASSPVLLLPLPRHASHEDRDGDENDDDDDNKDLRDLQQRVQQQEEEEEEEEEERREQQQEREEEQARAMSMGLPHESSSDTNIVCVAGGEALADIDTAEYDESQSHAMYLEALIGERTNT